MRYLIIVGHTPRNYCAHAPDVLGCVTTGRNFKETVRNMHEALEGHFEVMAEYGETIPEPTAWVIDVQGYVVPMFKTVHGYHAEPPDLYEIEVVADTAERTETLVREAVAARLASHSPDNPAPEPSAEVAYVDVDVPATARRT